MEEARALVEVLRREALKPSSASQPDVLDQLRKLAELRDAGVISNDEFEAKKADLLSRM